MGGEDGVKGRCIVATDDRRQPQVIATEETTMTIQNEAHARIVETIAAMQNGPEIAKQIFDAIQPRDGDVSREAQAILGKIIGQA